MHNKNFADNKDAQGMVLVLVLCLMAVLFLLGTAALNNITTEYRTSYNYMQSVQAFNNAEAGIGEAVGIISANRNPVLGAPQNVSSDLFQYSYTISYDSTQHIYTIISEGFDPSRNSSRIITAEYLSIFNPAVITSPVYSETGDFTGANEDCKIIGNPNCPPCVAGYWSNNSPVPAVTTSASSIDFSDDLNQLDTNSPITIKYNATPGIDFNKTLEFFKPKASFTSIATGDIIGSCTDYKIGYVLSIPPNPNFYHTVGGITGYGILVLEGNFKFSGTVKWEGLIICIGKLYFTGSGNKVTGAVLASDECEVSGDAQITWCPGTVRKAIQDFFAPPLELVSWKEN